jgi:NADH pyrophosphatase NudC (nudix superfamily)
MLLGRPGAVIGVDRRKRRNFKMSDWKWAGLYFRAQEQVEMGNGADWANVVKLVLDDFLATRKALLSIEWADEREFCPFCGRQRAEGHNSICRMNKHLRAAGL